MNQVQDRLPQVSIGDLSSCREFALRQLRSRLSADAQLVANFWSELATPEELPEADLFVLYCVVERAGRRSLLVEYVAGETVEELVKRADPKECEQTTPLLCAILDSFESRGGETAAQHEDPDLRLGALGIARAEAVERIERGYGNALITAEGLVAERVMAASGATGKVRAEVFPLLWAIIERLCGELPPGVSPEVASARNVYLRDMSVTPRTHEFSIVAPAEDPAPVPEPSAVPDAAPVELVYAAQPKTDLRRMARRVLIAAATAALVLAGMLGSAGLVSKFRTKESSLAKPLFPPAAVEAVYEAEESPSAQSEAAAARRTRQAERMPMTGG
ncbi:MAG: hypothetical protein IPM24_10025 [Bryobacterales bacterium]|nr:hypothetical protein [Bryobacterales bacterium]